MKPSLQQPNDAPQDREALIRQAFADDPAGGFELLFRTYYHVLCSNAVRSIHSTELAEAIVADVFIDFWKNEVNKHITCSYRTYLYRAVQDRLSVHRQGELRADTDRENG
jgi:DNA-directed RNA polymerase specialized sigma24 family protein